MKVLQFLLVISLSALFSVSFAQDITEGSRNFIKKESANALSIVVQGQTRNVEEVMDRKLRAATGQKSKTTKGLTMYESARLAGASTNVMDMYFRVEKASRSDKNHSRVIIFLSSGNNNFLDSETNPNEFDAAKAILNDLQLDVEIYELELAIDEQNKVIEKAVKDHDKMVSDSVKLEEKLAETIQEIETNKLERKSQLEVIDQENVKLVEFQEYLYQLQTHGYNKPAPVEMDNDSDANIEQKSGKSKSDKKKSKKDNQDGN
jgi:hypothetical protein